MEGDVVYIILKINFSFWDRVKVFFGCKMTQRVELHTENTVGKNHVENVKGWVGKEPKRKKREEVIVSVQEPRVLCKECRDMSSDSV